MKLDLDHLAQYIQGAEAIVRKDDCIVPLRFTAAEMHAFDGNSDFRRKSYAASCVRLAFTNTRAIPHSRLTKSLPIGDDSPNTPEFHPPMNVASPSSLNVILSDA